MLNEENLNNQTNSETSDDQSHTQPGANNSDMAEDNVVDLDQARDVNAKTENQTEDGKDIPQSVATEEQETADSESEELSELEIENQELKAKNEQILLHMADYENRAKRAEQQVKDVRQYAITGFAKDMLVVADNLGRALEALSGDSEKDSPQSVSALVEGVQMTLKELHNQLSKHGVELFDPVGEKFDPNFHQAMFEIPNTEVPNNTIISVQQKGYSIGDRILRPALVGVSKNSEKDATVEENELTASNQDEDNQGTTVEDESLQSSK